MYDKEKFKGILPALLTPFDKSDKVSKKSVEKLIRYNLAKGVDGFYVGADFSCPIVAGLSVDPGVYYGFLTREGEFLGMMTGTTQSHYLNIPVNLKYNFHALDFLDVFPRQHLFVP